MTNIGSLTGVLEGNRANIPVGVQVKEGVLIQVSGLRDLSALELDVEGVRVFKILDFHGLNPRSKNALRKRVPVVLSYDEVNRLLKMCRPGQKLAASLLYGSGLRLMECLRLRLGDVNFDRRNIRVFEGPFSSC
jgi:integrase